MKKLKILICGGTGFIGTNLVNSFKDNKNILITATYNKSKPKLKLYRQEIDRRKNAKEKNGSKVKH